MSIRLRLLFSYFAMLIIPVFLFLIAVFIIGLAYIGDIKNVKEFYNIDFRDHESIRQVINADENIFVELQMVSKYVPEKLENQLFLRSMDEKLQQVKSGLIIRKNGQITYLSPFLPSSAATSLPSFGSIRDDDHDEIKLDDHNYSIKQYDVVMNERDHFSIFVLKDIGKLEHIAKSFFPLIIISLVSALAITNGVLTYFVSRSILRPLRELKKATEEIKEGNLDFVVTPSSRDELGDLGVAFEKMRKKLKESIELQLQYEENRKELVSNISHDLKTPITAIKGYIEGIKDGVANTPEKLDKYLTTIYTKAADMDRLIDELFLFSKLDLKRLSFAFETVEITRYLDDCIDEIGFDLEKQGIFIERKEGSRAPLFVIADPEKVKRVLTNIIGNSAKYMDKEAGEIYCRVTDEIDRVIVEIGDNGPGIEARALPFIFDRFYRADESRNTSTGGSGLGLAIAKQIIVEHGGDIWAKSEEGLGTSVFFTLRKANGIETK